MDNEIEKYCYQKTAFFRDSFPFAIMRLSNRSKDFNLTKRFSRQFWKITCILKGSGNYVIGNQKIPFGEKSLIITHPEAETTWDIRGEELQLFNLVFDRSFLHSEIEEASDNCHFLKIFSAPYSTEYESPMFLLTADHEIDALIRRIYREFEDCRHNRELLIRLEFQELLLLIMRRVENRNHRNPKWTAQYVNTYIEHHFAEDFSLGDLAQAVELSPERLCRLFREHTGFSIMQKVKLVRLAAAKKLLETTALSSAEIARRTGFKKLSGFCRSFADKYGITPETLRKNSGH